MYQLEPNGLSQGSEAHTSIKYNYNSYYLMIFRKVVHLFIYVKGPLVVGI